MLSRSFRLWGLSLATLTLGAIPSCRTTTESEQVVARASSALENPPPPANAADFTFDLVYPVGQTFSNVTLGVTGDLILADRTTVQEPAAGAATVTALGNLTIGNDAKLGNGIAAGSITARDRVQASLLQSGGRIFAGNQDVIGSKVQNATETPFQRTTLSVHFPGTTSGSVLLPTDATKSLAPGRYDSVTVNARAHLKLTAGEYYWDALDLEPTGNIEIDNSSGGITKIFIRSQISAFRGMVSASDPSRVQLVYLGTNSLNVETSFNGALLSPYASVTIGSTPSTYAVTLFAKALSVGPGTIVKHLGFNVQPATPIISTTTTPPAFTPPSRDPIIQSRPVTIDIGTLQGIHNQVLQLDLFANASLRVAGVRIERNGPNGWVWVGRVENQPSSLVTLSLRNSVVSGDVFARLGNAWHTYRIRFGGNGVHLVQEMSVLQDGDDGNFNGQPNSPTGMGGKNGTGPLNDPCAGTDTGESIDALVGYTTTVKNDLGGQDAAEALVYESVAAANESYLNSGVSQRLRIVDVHEFAFTETDNWPNDVATLRASTGGFSTVGSRRDSHGADVVGVIVDEPSRAFCGRTFDIPSSVSSNFENIAYMITGIDCAATAGRWSLAHEFGHEMAARHDWSLDNTDNSPYHYNHGFVDTTNLFRTVMGYPDSCNALGKTCDRVPYWSNPDVKYNTFAAGIADNGMNPQPANNALTLNNTALTVANYRCSSPGTTTVWMRDTWDDTGKEPDPATVGEDMWESPYIWVRNEQDTTLVHQHEHQNPINGQANWVYVKLHNGGGSTEGGTLKLYWANASAGLSWPNDWTQLGSVDLNINQHSTQVAEIKWPTLPGTGHFCLVARWESASDPISHPETADIESNVRNNNKIVWHNVNIVSPSADGSSDVSSNMVGQGDTYALVIAPTPAESNGSFLLYGQVVAQLDPTILSSWIANGKNGQGFAFDPATGKITVTDPAGAVLTNIDLPSVGEGSSGFYPVNLHITRPNSTPARNFHLQVLQYVKTEIVPQVDDTQAPDSSIRTASSLASYVRLGGVSYELRP